MIKRIINLLEKICLCTFELCHFCYKKTLSLAFGCRCRFYPYCSDYWIEACRRFGPLYGTWLGMMRLCKCHPWHPGGLDVVPLKSAPKDLQ